MLLLQNCSKCFADNLVFVLLDALCVYLTVPVFHGLYEQLFGNYSHAYGIRVLFMKVYRRMMLDVQIVLSSEIQIASKLSLL